VLPSHPPGSRIQGSKSHRITDPQHCFIPLHLPPLRFHMLGSNPKCWDRKRSYNRRMLGLKVDTYSVRFTRYGTRTYIKVIRYCQCLPLVETEIITRQVNLFCSLLCLGGSNFENARKVMNPDPNLFFFFLFLSFSFSYSIG
jgi:hypothetical protein